MLDSQTFPQLPSQLQRERYKLIPRLCRRANSLSSPLRQIEYCYCYYYSNSSLCILNVQPLVVMRRNVQCVVMRAPHTLFGQHLQWNVCLVSLISCSYVGVRKEEVRLKQHSLYSPKCLSADEKAVAPMGRALSPRCLDRKLIYPAQLGGSKSSLPSLSLSSIPLCRRSHTIATDAEVYFPVINPASIVRYARHTTLVPIATSLSPSQAYTVHHMTMRSSWMVTES
jgi:hypothetical protein